MPSAKTKTKKAAGRKGPSESATKFVAGTVKRGNDGNLWEIVVTATGVHRWTKKSSATKRNSHHTKTSKKVSKRVLEMWNDPESVWGKNKPLETFWEGLASGKYRVVIYKNGTHKYVKPPNPRSSQKTIAFYTKLDADPEIVAVLSSNVSSDAYELYLYPKAKNSSVAHVIKNYKKYFKSVDASEKKIVYPS